MVLLSRGLASVPEEQDATAEKQQQQRQQKSSLILLDVFTNESISRRVRADIKQVLTNSWELREVRTIAAQHSRSSALHQTQNPQAVLALSDLSHVISTVEHVIWSGHETDCLQQQCCPVSPPPVQHNYSAAQQLLAALEAPSG